MNKGKVATFAALSTLENIYFYASEEPVPRHLIIRNLFYILSDITYKKVEFIKQLTEVKWIDESIFKVGVMTLLDSLIVTNKLPIVLDIINVLATEYIFQENIIEKLLEEKPPKRTRRKREVKPIFKLITVKPPMK